MSEAREALAPRFFLVAGCLSLGAIAYWVGPRAAYYWLPIAQRPLHPEHALLRPSGLAGLSFGIVGTVLIFLNLTYLLRKLMISVAWLGSLRSWMAFHVFTGLTGGALVLLHSALRPRSALGILGFTGLTVVIVTGLVGRYIYARTPRSLEGKELELDEIRRRLEEHRQELQKSGLPTEFFDQMRLRQEIQGSDKSIPAALWGLVAGDQELHAEARRLKALLSRHPGSGALSARIMPLAMRYVRERQWLARYTELRGLMGGWRFFHRWFAIVMLAAAAFHILVAFQLGQLWVMR